MCGGWCNLRRYGSITIRIGRGGAGVGGPGGEDRDRSWGDRDADLYAGGDGGECQGRDAAAVEAGCAGADHPREYLSFISAARAGGVAEGGRAASFYRLGPADPDR